MDTSFEEQVRERAYHIWLAGGMAEGQAHEHWTLAETAVKADATAGEPVVILTKAAPAKAGKVARPVVKATAKTTGKAAKPAAKPAAKLTRAMAKTAAKDGSTAAH